MSAKSSLLVAASIAALSIGASAVQADPTTPEQLQNALETPQNWLMTLGNYEGWHYSPLDTINRDNVSDLRPVFIASIGGNGTSTVPGTRGNEMAAPLVEDGFLYAVDSLNKIIKFDVTSGDRAFPLWRFDPQIADFKQYTNTRGLALWGNNILQATRDARIIAIDKDSGESVYEANASEPAGGINTDDMIATRELGGNVLALQTAGGRSIVTTGSGGAGIGWYAAYDTETGDNVWRTYTIPQPGEPNFGTWPGETWRYGAVMPWGPATYDAASNTIFIGTGEPSPVYDPEFRPGDNLYSVSTLALDADTGALKWYFQETPNDQNDFDSTGARIIWDYTAPGGETVKAVTNWARNGFTYTLNAETGEFIHAIAQGDNINWTAGIDPKTGKPVEYNPNLGTASVQEYAVAGPRRGRLEADAPLHCNTWGGAPTGIWPPSYDPNTGISYQTRTQGCTYQTIQRTTDEAFNPLAREGLGSSVRQVQVDTVAQLVAMDLQSGERVAAFTYDQGIPSTRQAEAGALATAGGVVFTGFADGTFGAYDSETLDQLWKFNTGTNLKGAAITYAIDGRQYVAHIAGGSQHSSGIAPLILPTAVLVVYGLGE